MYRFRHGITAGHYTVAFVSALFFDPPNGAVPNVKSWMSVSGNGQVIPDGTENPDAESATDFGAVAPGSSQNQSFTIFNSG